MTIVGIPRALASAKGEVDSLKNLVESTNTTEARAAS